MMRSTFFLFLFYFVPLAIFFPDLQVQLDGRVALVEHGRVVRVLEVGWGDGMVRL